MVFIDIDGDARTAAELSWTSPSVRNALSDLIGALIDWTERPGGGNYVIKPADDIPTQVVRVWNRYGFAESAGPRASWMHFEFTGTPADAIGFMQAALRDLAPGPPSSST